MYESIRTLRELDLANKRVFCRVDFNVPIADGHIVDETRVVAALPTLWHLKEAGAKIILATHLGRPKGKVVPELRVDLVAKALSKHLGQEVIKLDDSTGEDVERKISQMNSGDVILLENVRFNPGEEKNDADLAQAYAKLADCYVNDAFGVSHRAHASNAGIAQLLPGGIGLLVEKELQVLGSALLPQADKKLKPFAAIVGGAKVSDKIGVLKNLLTKVDLLLIGGGLAFTFLAARGISVGKSLLEEDHIVTAREVLMLARQLRVPVYLPIDVMVADSPKSPALVVDVEHIPPWSMGLDIGPRTCQLFKDLLEASALILWNGPLGLCEESQFAFGTQQVAKIVANSKAYSIVGGGDSIAAIQKYNLSSQIDHISTGGGATLAFLEGIELSGLCFVP